MSRHDRIAAGADSEGLLGARPGDAVDLEAVAGLEVAHRGLGSRAVATVHVEVVAERDEGDLELGDPIAGRVRNDVAAAGLVARRRAPG